MKDFEIRQNQLTSGLEFLGKMLMLRNGNRHGGNGLSGEEAEQFGCLLLCLSEYAQSLEE